MLHSLRRHTGIPTQRDPQRRLSISKLTALPRQQNSWSGLVERGDIVLDGGILHLVHDTVTPEEARIADLLLVADALTQAGVRDPADPA